MIKCSVVSVLIRVTTDMSPTTGVGTKAPIDKQTFMNIPRQVGLEEVYFH